MEELLGGGGMGNIVMIGAIVIVFYFFMIRPQQKKQKEEKKFREGLKKGDKIVTAGGIHGKIAETKEATVTIEVEGGMKMKLNRSSVSMSYSSGDTDGVAEIQETK
ncbi:MAG: preprotein translocase subunit YajC [Flavobacteriales bacterium]|jgi:preprotein translocase subunit YajC|nr:preprotein translocase subunit YajC [Flavobacteriales bacterium]